jgi:tellurite resistance protein
MVSGVADELLFAVAAAFWLCFVPRLLCYLPDRLRDPSQAPFVSLAPMTGMLLAHAVSSAALFWACFALTVLLAGLQLGEWAACPPALEHIHSGCLIPLVSGCFVAAQGAARFGNDDLGWAAFGIGSASWLLLGSVLLVRRLSAAPLPEAQLPLLAIEVGPPAIAAIAYADLTGGRSDPFSLALAGVTVLMVIVQLRLMPRYRRVPFSASYWSFTFVFAAVAALTMRTVPVLRWPALIAITALIGGIAIRSLWALTQPRSRVSSGTRSLVRGGR